MRRFTGGLSGENKKKSMNTEDVDKIKMSANTNTHLPVTEWATELGPTLTHSVRTQCQDPQCQDSVSGPTVSGPTVLGSTVLGSTVLGSTLTHSVRTHTDPQCQDPH